VTVENLFVVMSVALIAIIAVLARRGGKPWEKFKPTLVILLLLCFFGSEVTHVTAGFVSPFSKWSIDFTNDTYPIWSSLVIGG
jgi:Mn2+/Fe2+ NRAMP family transporter